jgi:hypothetical protein
MSRSELHPDLIAYIAGGLPAGEATAVREHLEGCPECRAEATALGSLRTSLRAIAGVHPDVEDLVAFEAGELGGDPARRATLEEHLALCADCRADRAALARMRRAAPARRFVPGRGLLGVAAVAAIGVLGLWALLHPWAPGTAPSPDGRPIIFAAPTRGRAAPPALPAGRSVTLEVLLPFGSPAGGYRARIDPGEVTLPVIPSDGSRVSLSLRAPTVPGRYRLVLIPEPGAAGDGEAVGPLDYPFTVTPAAGDP